MPATLVGMTRPRGRPAHPDVLTPAEWSVLDLYRHGLSQPQIASLRGTNEEAVRFHLRNIRDKLGTESVRDLRTWTGIPAGSAMANSARRARRFSQMETSLSLGPIGQIALLCRSAAQTEVWYREKLGLRHLYTYGPLVIFDCDGTRLYFREVPEAEWRPGSTIYFVVADITTAHAQLTEAGIAFSGAPHLIHRHDDGTEEWMAFFTDLDENSLALMSRVRPAG